MTITRISVGFALAAALVLETGCGAKKKEITESDRKQANFAVGEAQYAMRSRNWAEAEKELMKAVDKAPDMAPYWLSLGTVRIKLGKRAEAKKAYEEALKSYEAAMKEDKTDPTLWIQQIYVLGLLGRTDAARATVEKMGKEFPTNRDVRGFIDQKQFDQMLTDPNFTESKL